MLESAYPFLFIMNLKDEANQDGLLQVKLYRFKSTKSKITYLESKNICTIYTL